MGRPFPFKIAPQPKWHLDRLSRLFRAHFSSVTVRPTDHATQSMTIGRIYVRIVVKTVLQCGLITTKFCFAVQVILYKLLSPLGIGHGK